MRTQILLFGAAALLGLAACPGDLGPPSSGADQGPTWDGWPTYNDIGPRPDNGGVGTDSGGADAGTKLTCKGDCHDYVLDRILLPTSSAQAKAYAFKKGGQTYNAFGDLMVLVGSQVSGLNLQQDMDLSVYEGYGTRKV